MIAVFITSLLPQFVDSAHTSPQDLLVLGLRFNCMGVAWLLTYAELAARGRDVLGRPRVKRAPSCGRARTTLPSCCARSSSGRSMQRSRCCASISTDAPTSSSQGSGSCRRPPESGYAQRVIEKAAFGRTGHDSTRTIFGAAALGSVTQKEADATLEVLLEHEVNHIDTAASYGDSELRVAPWLKQHRDGFFLATKTGKRDYNGAREEIRRSLDRLGVDHVDLLQLHNLVDVIEWEFALRDGGALDAAVEARDEGLVRFIGVTGHGLTVAEMHLRSLERFPFDSVLLPYSYVQMRDERYAGDFERLAAVCAERGVAVQTIKAISLAPWEGREQTAATWYEPLREQEDIDVAVHWVLGRPAVFLNTVGDVTLLPKVLDAARRFEERPADGALDELLARRQLVPLFS
jgi:aryl-alcohol dehydrogenase-like predicted oxidoreductase